MRENSSSSPISLRLKDADAFRSYLAPLRSSEWVVYAKRPFAGPAQVLAYLARYTHRVAIANSRLLDLDDHHVSFRWKDYRENGGHKARSCDSRSASSCAVSCSTCCRMGSIAFATTACSPMAIALTSSMLCRTLLDVPAAEPDRNNHDEEAEPASASEPPPCPCCGGRMQTIETFDGPYSRPFHARRADSS